MKVGKIPLMMHTIADSRLSRSRNRCSYTRKVNVTPRYNNSISQYIAQRNF